MITGYELQKDLDARMLPFILYIGEIAGRKVHLVPDFVAGLLSPFPRCLDCVPIREQVDFLYRPLCHIHSPNYILLFTFLSGYVYTVPLYS